MVVLKMNCNLAEIRTKRPEILFRFTAPILCHKLHRKGAKTNSEGKKNYEETKTQRRK